MAISIDAYHRLCLLLRTRVIDSASLVNHFETDINSIRRLDSINTVGDLIDVLESRDVLGPNNIDNLIYIVTAVNRENPDSEIQRAVQELHHHDRMEGVIPRVERHPIERVHQLIINEIGFKWKQLARELDIPEGIIDSLESMHRGNFVEMVREVLNFHRDNAPDYSWRTKLQRALTEARRNDLSLRVGDILSASRIH
ncbi:uncharacterized protein LOC132705914 [Cylas formicarius]|uniref:uncharacterized protein LOC132705914 n=1 Tax=Cylas formicarius TaxID=197179 RepID=UPI002958B46C|nr:uncharacterized protein LOC132705914 [Cylas formicarius]